MNKTIILAVLLLGLAGCSGNQKNNSGSKKKTKGSEIISLTEEEKGFICATFMDSSKMVFRQLKDNTLSIVDFNTNTDSFHGDVIIPEQIEYRGISYPVTVIADEAFGNCKEMTSVSIPNSIKVIEERAFHDCKGLISIDIPNSVESIYGDAFRGCSGLTSVTVQHPGFRFDDDEFFEGRFDGCDKLKKSNVIQGKGYVEGDLVYVDSSKKRLVRCSSTTSGAITIPNGVTSIGDCAFRDCESLASISIPCSVLEIGNWRFGENEGHGFLNDRTFYGCDNLTNVTIYNPELYYLFCDNPKAVVYLKQNGSTKRPNDQHNKLIDNTKTPKIVSIEELQEDGYTYIVVVFDDSKRLEFKVLDDKPNEVAVVEVGGNPKPIGNLVIPDKVISNNKTYAVTEIWGMAFWGQKLNVTVPNSVTYIAGDAFRYVPNLAYSGTASGAPWGAWYLNGYVEDGLVYSDASKKKLVHYIYSATDHFTIPNTVKEIDNNAFDEGYNTLITVTVPSSVTRIAENAFDGVPNLEYSGSVQGTPWGAWHLNGYAEDGLLYQDASKTKIVYCSPIVSGAVLIPKSVKEIDDYVFNDFHGLLIVQNPNLQIWYDPSKILYQAEDGSLRSLESMMNQPSFSDGFAQDPRPRVYSNAYDGFVNIRQEPQSKSPILGVLKNGPEGAILLGTEGEWKKIDCNGIVGYVYEKYVQDTPTEVFGGE